MKKKRKGLYTGETAQIEKLLPSLFSSVSTMHFLEIKKPRSCLIQGKASQTSFKTTNRRQRVDVPLARPYVMLPLFSHIHHTQA
jgi:hypothetical protein